MPADLSGLLADGLRLLAVLAAALMAGGLMVIAAGLAPAYKEAPAQEWVRIHQRLDPHFDRYMPVPATATIVLGVLVAVVTPGAGRLLGALGAVGAVAVGIVSGARNIPINRAVRTWDAAAPPADATATLGVWVRFNRIRTAAALGALVSLAIAAIIA